MTRAVVDVRGLPEAKELLDSFTGRQLQNRIRQATRAGAKVMRTELRSRAQDPRFPSSFRKTKTRGHRTPLGTSVGPNSPLINIFEPGAKPHQIGGVGQMLHSQRGEPFFAALGPVDHPGMAARPLIGPTFDAAKDEAMKAAVDKLFEEFITPVPEGG